MRTLAAYRLRQLRTTQRQLSTADQAHAAQVQMRRWQRAILDRRAEEKRIAAARAVAVAQLDAARKLVQQFMYGRETPATPAPAVH